MNGKLTTSFLTFSLLLAMLLVAFYFPWIAGFQAYFKSDLTYYFQPFSEFIANAWKEGRLPLWNPYLYCGMAQAAVPSPGMFYPPMILFAVTTFSRALALFMVLHQLIAGCGAYLLIVSLGWGALAASVCGFAIALSGYMFSLTANYTLPATIAWLPLLLFFVRSIEASWTRRNVLRMFGASFCMFSMIAAGRPELFVPAALLVGAYVVCTAYGAYRHDRMGRQAINQALLRLIALGAGCMLASPVVLPAAEWIKLSPRAKGLDLRWVLMWSANWYDMLGVVLAQPLGDVTILGSKFLNLVASRPNALPYVTSSYVGPIIVGLAIWSLFDRTWRWRWLCLAILLGFLLMAAGNHTPFASFVCKLSPAFAAFRYPVKLMIFADLIIALMAARGASMSIERRVPTSAQITTAVLWGMMVAFGILLLTVPSLSSLTMHFPWNAGKPVNLAVMRDAQLLFGKNLAVCGGLGLLLSANYFAFVAGQLTESIFSFLVGGTLLLALIMPAFAYQHVGTSASFYDRKHPLADKIRPLISGQGGQRFASRVQPFYHDPLTPTAEFLKRENLQFQEGFYLFTRELMLPNTNVDFQIPYAFGYEAAEEGFYKDLFSETIYPSSQNMKRPSSVKIADAPLARFCYITSVSHATTQVMYGDSKKPILKLDPELFELAEENRESNFRIYKTRVHLPRAYFADSIRWNASKPEFSRVLLSRDNKKMLPLTYVEGDEISGIASGAAATAPGSIKFFRDDPEIVELEVNTVTSRLLVLTDRFYPGWRASLDGAPVSMRQVNFFARGVAVPTGRHIVRFEYRPASVWSGITIALITLLGYIIAAVAARAPVGRLKSSHVSDSAS